MDNPTFAELPLGPKLQAAIVASGYTVPTPIQAQAIPVAVTGRDVLGIAQTGTGKTASFVLPMIERLETGRARARMPRSLILAPTRELAAQCAQSFEKYGVNHRLNTALLIGGVSFDDQQKKLDRGVDVLIATPGRMIDHFQRGKLMLMGVEILVIDEADRMLDMGFIPDIEKICKLLPPKRQTLFFSATMPPEIQRLVDTFLKDPVRIEVAKPATAAKTITQRFRFCSSTDDWAKREILRELIASQSVRNAIIFCNRKRDVAILHKSLVKHGFNAGALHGDMDQSSRTATLDKFRAGELMLLAASDVAARGLDIPDVSHIFNYDIPWAGDDYIHRIGRTGRAGKEGVSLSLVTPEDLRLIKEIENVTGEQPVWIGEPPTEADFADSGKRRRGGRGGKPVAGRGEARGPSRGEARGAGRGEGRGDDRKTDRGEGRGPRRDRPRREGGLGDRPVAAEGAAPRRERGHNRPRREEAPGERPVTSAVSDGAQSDGAQPRRERGYGRSRPRREEGEHDDRPIAAGASEGAEPSVERASLERANPERDARREGGREGAGRDRPRRERRPADSLPGMGEQPVFGAEHEHPGRKDRTERAPRQERAPRPERGEPSESRAERPRQDRPEQGQADQGARNRTERIERGPERGSGRDRSDGGRTQNRDGDRPPRNDRPQREGDRRQQSDQGGGTSGFADNVPAFLRRPVRPKVAANE